MRFVQNGQQDGNVKVSLLVGDVDRRFVGQVVLSGDLDLCPGQPQQTPRPAPDNPLHQLVGVGAFRPRFSSHQI